MSKEEQENNERSVNDAASRDKLNDAVDKEPTNLNQNNNENNLEHCNKNAEQGNEINDRSGSSVVENTGAPHDGVNTDTIIQESVIDVVEVEVEAEPEVKGETEIKQEPEPKELPEPEPNLEVNNKSNTEPEKDPPITKAEPNDNDDNDAHDLANDILAIFEGEAAYETGVFPIYDRGVEPEADSEVEVDGIALAVADPGVAAVALALADDGAVAVTVAEAEAEAEAGPGGEAEVEIEVEADVLSDPDGYGSSETEFVSENEHEFENEVVSENEHVSNNELESENEPLSESENEPEPASEFDADDYDTDSSTSDMGESEEYANVRRARRNRACKSRKPGKRRADKSLTESDTEYEDLSDSDSLYEVGRRKKNKRKRRKKRSSKKSRAARGTVSDEDSEGVYEVDKILDVKYLRNGKRMLLISWRGYSSDYDSWEPEENLNCQDLIDEFFETNKKVTGARNNGEREREFDEGPSSSRACEIPRKRKIANRDEKDGECSRTTRSRASDPAPDSDSTGKEDSKDNAVKRRPKGKDTEEEMELRSGGNTSRRMYDSDESDSEDEPPKRPKRPKRMRSRKEQEGGDARDSSSSEIDNGDEGSRDDETGDATEYEVDRIIDVRYLENGRREFLIQWKGFSKKDNSWEPESNLNCNRKLEAFLRERRVRRLRNRSYGLPTRAHRRKLSLRGEKLPRPSYKETD